MMRDGNLAPLCAFKKCRHVTAQAFPLCLNVAHELLYTHRSGLLRIPAVLVFNRLFAPRRHTAGLAKEDALDLRLACRILVCTLQMAESQTQNTELRITIDRKKVQSIAHTIVPERIALGFRNLVQYLDRIEKAAFLDVFLRRLHAASFARRYCMTRMTTKRASPTRSVMPPGLIMRRPAMMRRIRS